MRPLTPLQLRPPPPPIEPWKKAVLWSLCTCLIFGALLGFAAGYQVAQNQKSSAITCPPTNSP